MSTACVREWHIFVEVPSDPSPSNALACKEMPTSTVIVSQLVPTLSLLGTLHVVRADAPFKFDEDARFSQSLCSWFSSESLSL